MAETSDSILNDVKKVLQIEPDETTFDVDIVMHVNTVFSVLTQLGVGPSDGFVITDDSATWASYLGGDMRLSMVKTYIYARVRLLFDPPSGSYHLVNALNAQVEELTWRITAVTDIDDWTPPVVASPDLDAAEVVIVIPVNNLIEGGV